MNDKERAAQVLTDAGFTKVFRRWERARGRFWDTATFDSEEFDLRFTGPISDLRTLLQPPLTDEDEEEAIRWAIAQAIDAARRYESTLLTIRAKALQGLLTRLK